MDELDLRFLDHKAAFKSKTTWEVLRANIVFQLCSVGPLVEHNMKLMKLGQKVLGKKIFGQFMKGSFYGQFVAGEDRQRIKPVINRMHSFGVKSILDYSVEEDISEQQAENLEMDSTIPDKKKEDGSHKPEQTKVKGTYEDEIRRYQAHKSFGDRRSGVNSARTYFYKNESECERNMETFLRCIEAVADTTHGTGFAAIKITALGRPNLLLQLSEVIVRARRYYQEVKGKKGFALRKDDHSAFENRFKQENIYEGNEEVQKWLGEMSDDKKGLLHLFSWSGLIDSNLLLKEVFLVPHLKTGEMTPIMSTLTEREEEQFRNMLARLQKVFQAAKDVNVRVMVDAEQTYFQPAIHRLTMEMQKKYNTEEAIVFNTYQCYLKNAFNALLVDLEQAQEQNFYFGAKLVRGAYMEQERARAASLGYKDPINESYEATSEMYHRCLTECMRRMAELKKIGDGSEQRIGIMVASHNADTIRFAIQRMKELDIKPEDRLICFGQLLGMCDQLSFPLGQAGYSVYKYVPYGPVNEVLPYLSRRAQENKGLLSRLETDKMLLRRELFSRLAGLKLFYKPQGNYKPVGFDHVTMKKPKAAAK